MALDGIVVANLAHDLNQLFAGARISKIAQPEKDELLLTLKGTAGQKRLVLSASASLPLVYITEKNKTSPMTAPNFCMLLRKHIANGRILSVTQPGMERVLIFEVEHLNDLGDLCRKRLIVELMGKHSNLIFCTEDGQILDSIKHVSAQVSSVREVLPGRQYFIPAQEGKKNPLEETKEGFIRTVSARPQTVKKAVYTSYTGLSPLAANELCYRAGIDGDAPCASVPQEKWRSLGMHFQSVMNDIREGRFYAAYCETSGGTGGVCFDSAVFLCRLRGFSVPGYFGGSGKLLCGKKCIHQNPAEVRGSAPYCQYLSGAEPEEI